MCYGLTQNLFSDALYALPHTTPLAHMPKVDAQTNSWCGLPLLTLRHAVQVLCIRHRAKHVQRSSLQKHLHHLRVFSSARVQLIAPLSSQGDRAHQKVAGDVARERVVPVQPQVVFVVAVEHHVAVVDGARSQRQSLLHSLSQHLEGRKHAQVQRWLQLLRMSKFITLIVALGSGLRVYFAGVHAQTVKWFYGLCIMHRRVGHAHNLSEDGAIGAPKT